VAGDEEQSACVSIRHQGSSIREESPPSALMPDA
jgi:hypothetical protein